MEEAIIKPFIHEMIEVVKILSSKEHPIIIGQGIDKVLNKGFSIFYAHSSEPSVENAKGQLQRMVIYRKLGDIHALTNSQKLVTRYTNGYVF